jgi:hypothetical protein
LRAEEIVQWLYDRNVKPYNRSWESWAADWCKWMLSFNKRKNPCLDKTGRYSSLRQENKNVWFLAGTFGNITHVTRRSEIPAGRSILFPLLVKEDSFAEDRDLKTERELIERARDATDKALHLEVIINGVRIPCIKKWRVQSKIFELVFPEDNVYDVRPGTTRAVCDGFWIFIKPLPVGEHSIYFKGETTLEEPITKKFLRKTSVYSEIWNRIDRESVFCVEILYKLKVV